MNIIFKGKVAKEGYGYKIGQSIQGNGYIKGVDGCSYIGNHDENGTVMQFTKVYSDSITQEIYFSSKKELSKTIERFNNSFAKSDLMTGDVILRRNGSVEIICLQTGTTISPTGFNFLNDLKEDLTSTYNDSGWDTIAVRRPREPHHCQFCAFKQDLGDLVYERE